MGIFSGIEKAEISERGKYLPPGFVGKLKVRRTLAKDSVKSGLAFIVEFEVLESNHDEFPVGSSATWFQKMTDRTVSLPAIKAWLAAVSGIHPGDRATIDAEIGASMESILDEACQNETNNNLIGLEVLVETVGQKTKKGFDFTRHNWLPAN